MTRIFCNNAELCLLEKQMRQPPGYRPRGHDIYMTEDRACITRENYKDLVDYVICHMHMEQLRIRIREIFSQGNVSIFRNPEHRKRYDSMIKHLRVREWGLDFSFESTLYLLAADAGLWNKVRESVLDTGIRFEQIKLGAVTLEQYILFHGAKDMYYGTRHIRVSELSDRELIPDEILRLIVNGYVVEKYGMKIVGQGG